FFGFAGRAIKISETAARDFRRRIEFERLLILSSGFVEAQRDVESDREKPVCFGEIRRELHCVLSDAHSLSAAFNAEIEARNFEKSLWVTAKLCLNRLRRFDRCLTLAAQVEVHRNLRDHAVE